MTHIDEGRLQALIDNELRLDERHRVERHLASCESCRAEAEALRGLSGTFSQAVETMPGSPPRREHGIGWPRRGASRLRRILPRAAVLLLFAGAASATIPGSPVRRWFGVEPSTTAAPVSEVERGAQSPASVAAAAPAVESGVSVEPVDGAVDILLHQAGGGLKIHALLVEGPRAGVYASGAAASSRFRTGAGRIEVLNARGGELRIELPRGVAAATVTVNGKEYLRKQGESLDLPVAGSADAAEGIDFSVQP